MIASVKKKNAKSVISTIALLTLFYLTKISLVELLFKRQYVGEPFQSITRFKSYYIRNQGKYSRKPKYHANSIKDPTGIHDSILSSHIYDPSDTKYTPLYARSEN